MLRVLLLSSAMMAVQEPHAPPAGNDKPDAKVEAEAAEARALAEYNAVRGRTPDTAAAHWKTAVWCEQKGLKAEAYFHFGRVIELDPKREAAWQRLGFKKHDGRWMTPDQITADEEQLKAEKNWIVQLKKWHKDIHGGKKQAEARAALDAITDPTAVSSVYREFAGGGPRDQEIAVQLLGQIESPLSSKTLTFLAVYGKSPAVRRLSTETLRGRKPEDYLDLLVGLMKDPLRYEVKPVGGPGSPGVLFVEEERFNVQRFYAPPAPNYQPRPGDAVGYDINGMPVITRAHMAVTSSNLKTTGVPGSKSLAIQQGTQTSTTTTETFSFAEAIAEAQRGAMFAQAQLAGDIERVEATNQERKKFSELVIDVARAATGKNPGSTAQAWRELLASTDERYSRRPRKAGFKPTVGEVVPLAYVPNLSPTLSVSAFSQTSFIRRTIVDS